MMAIITTPLPYVFVNGTTADATQVNADLNQIVSGVNGGAQPLQAPNAITASVNFLTRSTGGAATITNAYNISGVTADGSGNYTFLFTNALGNNTYGILVGGLAYGAGTSSPLQPVLSNRTVNSFTVTCYGSGGHADIAPNGTLFTVAVIGGY